MVMENVVANILSRGEDGDPGDAALERGARADAIGAYVLLSYLLLYHLVCAVLTYRAITSNAAAIDAYVPRALR